MVFPQVLSSISFDFKVLMELLAGGWAFSGFDFNVLNW